MASTDAEKEPWDFELGSFLERAMRIPGVETLESPAEADGMCLRASHRVVRFAVQLGHRAHIVLLTNSACSNRLSVPVAPHFIANVEGFYIDLTARQFDVKASFPLVSLSLVDFALWDLATEPFLALPAVSRHAD